MDCPSRLQPGFQIVADIRAEVMVQTRAMYVVHVKWIEFTWDQRKNRANGRKHGVPFAEATGYRN